MQPHLIPDPAQGFQGDIGIVPACADREHERIHHKIFLWNAVRGGSLHDLFCHAQAPFDSLRDPALVKTQTDQQGAVFLCDREHALHGFLLAVDGIEHRFSVVVPQSALHRRRVGSIDLQRQIDDRLYAGDGFLHGLRLVDLGQPYIDIKDMGTVLLLRQPFLVDILHVMIPERLLEF